MTSPKSETNKKWASSDNYRTRYDEIFKGRPSDLNTREMAHKLKARLGSINPLVIHKISEISPCASRCLLDAWELIHTLEQERIL